KPKLKRNVSQRKKRKQKPVLKQRQKPKPGLNLRDWRKKKQQQNASQRKRQRQKPKLNLRDWLKKKLLNRKERNWKQKRNRANRRKNVANGNRLWPMLQRKKKQNTLFLRVRAAMPRNSMNFSA